MHDPITTDDERIQRILDVKHSPADLKVEEDKNSQISKEQKTKLKQLLFQFEELFDGTLGTWWTESVQLHLKDPNYKPIHARPYPVLQSQVQKFEEEVKRLCKIGIFENGLLQLLLSKSQMGHSDPWWT